MLIDFAKAISVDLFKLGRVYTTIVRGLCLRMPLVDPSVFIYRFCGTLQINPSYQLVKNASKILILMDRCGKRPGGLCIAAIVIVCKCLNIPVRLKQAA